MLDETDIQKLLRLKRHEQPPAGYHQKFLQDFHRRQRADMLQQPVWRIALERLGAFFSDGMGRAAYGAATVAVLLFAGVLSYNMIESSSPSSSHTPSIAWTPPSPVVPDQSVADISSPAPDQPFQLSYSSNTPVQLPSPNLPAPEVNPMTAPHHILDSRPVSYERSFSF